MTKKAGKVRTVYRKAKRSAGRHKMSFIRINKYAIAEAPVIFTTYDAWKSGGAKHAAAVYTKSYAPFDIETNQFDTSGLAVGYVPLGAAWLYGKIASRVLR